MRVVPGYEKYFVTDSGDVFSTHSGKPRKLKTFFNHHGYAQVGLCKKDKCKNWFIHRLVLETYLGPPLEGQQGCHLDGNKPNNSLSNLAYATAKENTQQKKQHGTYQSGEKNPFAKLSESDVMQIRERFKRTGARVCNANELAKEFGVSAGNIRLLVNNKSWVGVSDNPQNPTFPRVKVL